MLLPLQTAAWIHSRIHALDPEGYAVVFHTHQPWATALCCLKDPTYVYSCLGSSAIRGCLASIHDRLLSCFRLPMAHQNCLRFYKVIGVYTHS